MTQTLMNPTEVPFSLSSSLCPEFLHGPLIAASTDTTSSLFTIKVCACLFNTPSRGLSPSRYSWMQRSQEEAVPKAAVDKEPRAGALLSRVGFVMHSRSTLLLSQPGGG